MVGVLAYSAVAGASEWTTRTVAEEEWRAMEHSLGVPMPAFTYHERFAWGHEGWVTYRKKGGAWVFDMYLRPLYASEALARTTSSHELGHVYAIRYLDDNSETTAWMMSACFGKTPNERHTATVEECVTLRERVREAAGVPTGDL